MVKLNKKIECLDLGITIWVIAIISFSRGKLISLLLMVLYMFQL